MIQNKSSKDWPSYPLIRNYSYDYKQGEEISVNHILKYNQTYEFVYEVEIPKDAQDKFLIINMNLVDPVKNERFGDSMHGVIEIEREDFILQEIDDNFDESYIQNDNMPSNRNNFLDMNCSKNIDYIDSVLNQFNDDDPAMIEPRKFQTGDVEYMEEIRRLKDYEEEEKQKRLNEFSRLV